MKRVQLFTDAAALVMSALLAVASTASAQQSGTTAQQRQTQQQRGARQDAGAVANLDDTTPGANVRASQLMGLNIENSRGEGVGEVNDIVINTRTGKVNYAAVTYGGFLGMGDEMFAVPWEAFQYKQDPDDADETILVLNVTEKQLEGAQGFDQDHWPNFADKNWKADLDKRYGVDRNRVRNRVRDRNRNNRRNNGVDVEVDDDGSTDVDINRDNTGDRDN